MKERNTKMGNFACKPHKLLAHMNDAYQRAHKLNVR